MIHRIFVGLALSTCLVACMGKTTSLGGPRSDEPSTTTTDGGARAPTATVTPSPSPSNEEPEPEPDGDGDHEWTPSPPDGSGCHSYSYSYAPVPSAEPCEYVLPVGIPSGSSDPRLDPKNWVPKNVGIMVGFINGSVPLVEFGHYLPTSDACGSGDGWYYVDLVEGTTPTLFGICPKSCASVTGGKLLRLSATTVCE